MAMDISEAEITARVSVCELFVVQPQRVKQRRMEIMHVHLIGDGVVSEFVGFSIGDSRPESASCNPDGKACRIVIPSRPVFFRIRRAAEFASPPNDGVLEHAALL